MEFCPVWTSLTLEQKDKLVKDRCKLCFGKTHATEDCHRIKWAPKCRECGEESSHHFLLCPKVHTKTGVGLQGLQGLVELELLGCKQAVKTTKWILFCY